MRIGRIGIDHVQVFIRPAFGDTELLALVERLEQLVDAGFDTIDVAFEGATHDTTQLVRGTSTAPPDEVRHLARPADQPRTGTQANTTERNGL